MKICMMCKTEKPEDFSFFNYDLLCDSCISTLNYWSAMAFDDFNINGHVEKEKFNEGLSEYAEYRIKNYNEEIRRKRNAEHIKRSTDAIPVGEESAE